MHHAHLNDLGRLNGRRDGLRLLRDHSATILRTDGYVGIHALILLLKEAQLVVLRLICLQEEVDFFLLDLLGHALGHLLLCALQR